MPFTLYDADKQRQTITVSEQVTHRMAEGLGFNWYAAYDLRTYPAADDEARWERIFAHAEWLNIQFVRFGQSGNAMCDERGRFRPGHFSFDQLRRLNAWAEPRGMHLLLDPFSIPRVHQFEPWPEARTAWDVPGRGYALGVKDVDRYVSHFVVPYVKYVVEEMGCRAVTWFNHVNEPLQGNICSTPPGTDDHVHYVQALAAIRQGLNEAGLSHIGNMAPDTNTHRYWPLPHMLEMGADPDPYVQAYCMHHYHSHFDWDRESTNIGSDPMTFTIDEQLTKYRDYAYAHGKPYLVTELGMFHYGWATGDPAGIARHDNTVLEAEFAVRALARGADCVLRWAWLNPGTLDGWWQLITTTDGSDAPVRDPYYGYGTLMRYVGRQAGILATAITGPAPSPQTLHATAVQNGDGSRTMIFVNDHYTDCAPVLVRFPAGAGTVRKVVNDPVRKHEEVAEITVSGGALEHADVLSPMSLTVYTTAKGGVA
jgi:hypothetical protein